MPGNKKSGPSFHPMYLIPKSAYYRLMEVMDEDEWDAPVEKDDKNYLERQLDYKEGPSFRGPGTKKAKLLASLLKGGDQSTTTLGDSTNLSESPASFAKFVKGLGSSTPQGWKNSPIRKALSKRVRGKLVCPICGKQHVSVKILSNHFFTEHANDVAVRNHAGNILNFEEDDDSSPPSSPTQRKRRKPPTPPPAPRVAQPTGRASGTPAPGTPAQGTPTGGAAVKTPDRTPSGTPGAAAVSGAASGTPKSMNPSSPYASKTSSAKREPQGGVKFDIPTDFGGNRRNSKYFGASKGLARTPPPGIQKGQGVSYDNTALARLLMMKRK